MDFKLFSEGELHAFLKTLKEQEFSELAQQVREELKIRSKRPKKLYTLYYNGITKRVMALNHHEAIESIPVLCKGIIKEGRRKKRFAREKNLVYLY